MSVAQASRRLNSIKKYYNRKDSGLCVRCGKEPLIEGITTGENCADRERKRKKPFPLTDIQTNSQRITNQTKWLKRLVYSLIAGLLLGFLTIWGVILKVLMSGAVNTYIAHCV